MHTFRSTLQKYTQEDVILAILSQFWGPRQKLWAAYWVFSGTMDLRMDLGEGITSMCCVIITIQIQIRSVERIWVTERAHFDYNNTLPRGWIFCWYQEPWKSGTKWTAVIMALNYAHLVNLSNKWASLAAWLSPTRSSWRIASRQIGQFRVGFVGVE